MDNGASLQTMATAGDPVIVRVTVEVVVRESTSAAPLYVSHWLSEIIIEKADNVTVLRNG